MIILMLEFSCVSSAQSYFPELSWNNSAEPMGEGGARRAAVVAAHDWA